MEEFVERMHLRKGIRVIDLGGTPEIWNYLRIELDITILNLPDEISSYEPGPNNKFNLVPGDACSAEMFTDNSFDLVFSNSVIEHLPIHKQTFFADTVRRLAPAWWVQTPSINFPIEAHCNLPFWWSYSLELKEWWIKRWQQQGNYYLMAQMQTTSVLTRERMKALFGDCEIFFETFLGIEKSYSVYRECQ